MRITEYNIETAKKIGNVCVACVSDIHARKADRIIDALNTFNMDAILLAGDILEVSNLYMRKRNTVAFDFLEEVSKLAPVYYCFGNHEIYYSHVRREEDRIPNKEILNENIEQIRSMGIHLINDEYEHFKSKDSSELCIGGLVCGKDMDPALNHPDPDLEFLNSFDFETKFKILLCHYPHYYEKYLNDTMIDLILSGHAHGGQWRIFGRGVYAPHQGLFPKYTSGIYDNRLIISRGAVNNSKPIPRFFNSPEILKINIFQKRP